MTTWREHVDKWKDCQRCPLAQQRGSICLARGTVPCDVLLVGEAPGASEDALGRPFVGPAGDLLDKIVRRAVDGMALCATCGRMRCRRDGDWTCADGHDRTAGHGGRVVYCAYTNLVACYPREAKMRGDNEPEADEVRACEPRLVEFVNIARPRLIVCVGQLAAQWVDHGDSVAVADIPHPAWILGHVKPLSRQERETHHCVVVLRNAVEDMAGKAEGGFREWRNGGYVKPDADFRGRRRYSLRPEDLPF